MTFLRKTMAVTAIAALTAYARPNNPLPEPLEERIEVKPGSMHVASVKVERASYKFLGKDITYERHNVHTTKIGIYQGKTRMSTWVDGMNIYHDVNLHKEDVTEGILERIPKLEKGYEKSLERLIELREDYEMKEFYEDLSLVSFYNAWKPYYDSVKDDKDRVERTADLNMYLREMEVLPYIGIEQGIGPKVLMVPEGVKLDEKETLDLKTGYIMLGILNRATRQKEEISVTDDSFSEMASVMLRPARIRNYDRNNPVYKAAAGIVMTIIGDAEDPKARLRDIVLKKSEEEKRQLFIDAGKKILKVDLSE